MARIAGAARGFLYMVALTGTTGERAGPAPRLASMLSRGAAGARDGAASRSGFGIGEPDQAAAAAAAGRTA